MFWSWFWFVLFVIASLAAADRMCVVDEVRKELNKIITDTETLKDKVDLTVRVHLVAVCTRLKTFLEHL